MLSPKFSEALVFATELHKDQHRKQTQIPYISHLLAVAGLRWNMAAPKKKPLLGFCMMPLRIRVALEYGATVVAIVDGWMGAGGLLYPSP